MSEGTATRRLGFLLGLALGVGLGWGVARLGPSDEEPTAQERVLVDATLPLRSEGAFFPFTLDGPSEVRVTVHLPAMLEGQVSLGPLYAAMRPELVYEAEPREDHTFAVKGCSSPPIAHRFEEAGAYAVRIPAIPTAMGMESEMFVTVTVRVRAKR